jgi:hypothetical protein
LPLLEKVITNEEGTIREKALEILKKFSQYDYTVLFKSKIGYRAQRTALDYILKWSPKKCLTNLDFVLIVAKELLSSSVEGSSWKDENTLTMNFSQVDPTDFLKKMRRDTMNFIYDLYTKTSDAKIKLQLASVIEEVMRGPMNIVYSDSIVEMIEEDTKYLAVIYRKMIFDKSGHFLKENIAIAEEVEERLYYFAKPERKQRPELIKLREDILKDPFYDKVSPMIGRRAAYKGEEGYEESRALRVRDMQNLISQISVENLDEWEETLDILARQKDVIDEWKLADLKRFLEMLSQEKPEIADRFLEAAFKEKSALVSFSVNFLFGFQNGRAFDLWDKYTELIIKEKNTLLVGGICASLIISEPEKSQKKLRPNELAILKEIVFKKGSFSFLKRKDDANTYLHDRLLNALASNFRQHQKEMESLIKQEMENNPKYINLHYNVLQFVVTAIKWIDLSLASKSFIQYLLKKIVEAPGLDWHLQELMIALCGKDFACIMSVFEKRIARHIQLKENDKSTGMKRLMKPKEFEAVPHHFNPDLQKLIQENKDFPKAIQKWVKKMNLGWSLYNWEVSQFLDSLKIHKRQVLSDIVERGDDKDLLRVAYVIEGIGEADFELGMQIIGRTDNDKIHKKIGATMYATGVVSGEYGIADAYKGKIGMLQKYKESKNKRIKRFATEMIGYLQKSEEEERKRTAEAIQLRKIRFEG